jgi:hypothetical protein
MNNAFKTLVEKPKYNMQNWATDSTKFVLKETEHEIVLSTKNPHGESRIQVLQT